MPSLGPFERQRRTRRMVVAGLIVAAVVSLILISEFDQSVTPLGGAAGDTGDTTISEFQVPMTAALKPYYEQKLSWTPCAHHDECATVRAPLDWQHVSGQSVGLAIVKHAATGKRLGSLLVDPGGPGGSGVELVEGSVDDAVDSVAAKSYDVIGFDPRGVGGSSPVKCYDAKGMDAYLYGIVPGTIGSASWIAAEKRRAREFAAACEKNTGAILGHIDTINAAHDMDVIRAALGDPKLNYVGYSYGSYLGTIYAGLYPTRTGRLVFDGADDPWGDDPDHYSYDDYGSGDDSDDGQYYTDPADDGNVAQAQAFDTALTHYVSACVTESIAAVGEQRCPFTGSRSQALTRISKELVSLDKHPLTAADGRELGSATLATAIDSAMYDSTDWPDLTHMFAQLFAGHPAPAFEFADEYNDRNPRGTYDDNDGLANLAINCLEDGHDVDLDFDAQEEASLKKYAPILGAYAGYEDLGCSGWKYGPAPFPAPVHAAGSGPILVLGTTGDPSTPYADAKALAKQLDNGHLITFRGEGHTAYDLGNSCIDGTVDDYLIHGTVPPVDPSC